LTLDILLIWNYEKYEIFRTYIIF